VLGIFHSLRLTANKDPKHFRKCLSPSAGSITGDNTLKWLFKTVSPSPFQPEDGNNFCLWNVMSLFIQPKMMRTVHNISCTYYKSQSSELFKEESEINVLHTYCTVWLLRGESYAIINRLSSLWNTPTPMSPFNIIHVPCNNEFTSFTSILTTAQLSNDKSL
jgi:hypothetical protein